MKKIVMMAVMTIATMSVTAQDVMKKQSDGTYVVNTTTLAKDVKGYKSTTPVEIHIQKNKVVKVVALKNTESPKYFAKVKAHMMKAWDGMKVSKAVTAKVDGVTGATMSSDAVKENVKRGLEYYKKHK